MVFPKSRASRVWVAPEQSDDPDKRRLKGRLQTTTWSSPPWRRRKWSEVRNVRGGRSDKFRQAGEADNPTPSLAEVDFLNIRSRISNVLKLYERLQGLSERSKSTTQGVLKYVARNDSNYYK
jgi:hypothetical protein